MLILTTDHPASSYNLPVVIDSETRQVYDYADGLRRLRQQHELTRAAFAALPRLPVDPGITPEPVAHELLEP